MVSTRVNILLSLVMWKPRGENSASALQVPAFAADRRVSDGVSELLVAKPGPRLAPHRADAVSSDGEWAGRWVR